MNVLRMWMQPYGAESPKATILYANTLSISSLWKARDTSQPSTIETVTYTEKSDGTVQVWGAPALKGTEAYPIGFGEAVGNLFVNHRCHDDGIPLNELVSNDCSQDPWEDAGLPQVLSELQALKAQQSQ